MSWWNIIKIEDIDFETKVPKNPSTGERRNYTGYYSREGPNSREEIKDALLYGKDPIKEKIRINLPNIKQALKRKLERDPTDREFEEYLKRVIMHEAGHGGMSDEQAYMDASQAEYGAYTSEFPNNPYYTLVNYLNHPATNKERLPSFLRMAGFDVYDTKDSIEYAKGVVGFIDSIVIVDGKKGDDVKNKLVKLEMMARKKNKPRPSPFTRVSGVRTRKDLIKRTLDLLIDRYSDFMPKIKIYQLMEEIIGRPLNLDDSEKKMQGAVTTASSPAMFNQKAIRRKKRKGEEYA